MLIIRTDYIESCSGVVPVEAGMEMNIILTACIEIGWDFATTLPVPTVSCLDCFRYLLAMCTNFTKFTTWC